MADRYRVGDNVSNTKEITHFATPAPETASENAYVETLPGDPRSRPVLTATEFSSNNSHKKKSTSFQITSVTVQGSRLGNDTGDDSADDLDESHTEDISSDVLDCSKTTDLDNELVSSDNSNANVEDFGLSSLVLPSIQPISTKPGDSSVNFTVPLTIGVSPDHFTDVTIEPNVTNTGVTLVTTTTSPPGVTAQVPMVNSMPDHWQHRFKVVKIVSSEPFKRGRWLCMDFTDPPAIHNEPKADTTEVNLQNNSTEPLPIQNSINILTTVEPSSDKQNAGGGVTHVYEFPVNQSLPGSIAVKLNSNQAASQPVYSILVPVSSAPVANSVQAPNLTTTAATGVQTGSSIVAPASSVAQNVGVQTAPVTVISSSQPPVTTITTTAVLPNPNNSIPASNIQQQQMMGSSTVVVSNPSVVQINQAPPPTQLPQTSNVALQQQTQDLNQLPQQKPVVSNIPVVQATSLPPPISSEMNNLIVNVSSAVCESSQPTLAAQQQKNNLDANTNIAASASVISNNQSPLLEMLPDALGTKALQDGDDPESIYSLANHLCLASGFGQLPANQEFAEVATREMAPIAANQINRTPQCVVPNTPPSTWLPSAPLVQVQGGSTYNRAVMVESLTLSAPAGTSTVAIDNKIEQAMDLVKSHLMFAVREEVDVLKEKITELMDRISQLELENGILKANATQETLSQLPPASGTQVNPQMTQQNTQNTQTGTQTLPTNGGQIIRPPNSNQNQTQNNQQTTTS